MYHFGIQTLIAHTFTHEPWSILSQVVSSVPYMISKANIFPVLIVMYGVQYQCEGVISPLSLHSSIVSMFLLLQVFLSGSFPARWNHTTGVIHKSQTHVRSVSFGGCPENPSKYTSPDNYPCMAQTTIVDLGELHYCGLHYVSYDHYVL